MFEASLELGRLYPRHLIRECFGLNCVPAPISYVEVLTPILQNVTAFEDGVFKVVIEVR